MKKYFSIILYSFLFLLFNSCNKENAFDCIKTTGDIVQEERAIASFNKIYIEDNVNIIIVQNQTGKIIIEGGKNILPKINTDLSGNTLNVKNSNTCDWVRSYNVPINLYVGANQVALIEHRGSGTVTTQEQISTDTLRIYNWQKGQVNINVNARFVGYISADLSTNQLSGKTNKLAVICYDLAQLDASALSAKEVYIINNAQGDSKIQCDSLLEIELRNTANIYYSGNPVIQFNNKSGTGSLIKN